MPAHHRILVAEPFAAGEPELLADQVNPGDFLGNRVLHLQPRIDLEEGNSAVLANQEFTGPRALVPRFAQDRLGGRVQAFVLLVRQERRRRFLNQFLVPALQRTIPGGHHHHRPVGVRQALRFDMPGSVQEAFDEAFSAAERGRGLAHGGIVELGDFLPVADHLDAAPTPAERGFNGQRQPEAVRKVQHFLDRGHRVLGSGHQRSPDPFSDMPGLDLVSELVDGSWGRADPGQPGIDDPLGEFSIF